MAVNLHFHRCENVRLAATFRSNANSVSLVIEHDGGETEITLFDLPSEVTDKFAIFRDKWTVDHADHRAA